MSRAPDLAGRVLDGRYELRDLIGEGTFGRVYAGFDRRLQRAVAVKVIKPWWAEDPVWVERFEREAQLLASVSDPGIVQIFDVGSAEDGSTTSPSWCRARASRSACSAARCRRPRPRASPRTSAARSRERTRSASSTATSSPRTSCIDTRGAREGRRLRRRAARRREPARRRGDCLRHAALHVARAGRGAPDERGERRLRASASCSTRCSPGDRRSTGRSPWRSLYGTSRTRRRRCRLRCPWSSTSIVDRALAKEPGERYADGAELASALARVRPGLPAAGPAAQWEPPTTVLPGEDRTTVLPGEDRTTVLPGGEATTVMRGEDETTVLPGGDRTTVMAAGATTVLPGGDRTTALPVARSGARRDARRARPGRPGLHRPVPRRAAPLPPNRRRLVWPLMIAALLIVAGALVLARKPKTTVPELRGLSRGGVSARAGRHELKPDFARRYSSSTPRNVAISQDPEPGARVGEGSTVRVTLSDGPAPVAVPQLKGKGIAAARDALDKVGLRASVRSRTSAGTPAGTVLEQSPAPPAKAVPGTSVRLTSSRSRAGTPSRTSPPRTRPVGAVPDTRRAVALVYGWPTRSAASCSSSASARRRRSAASRRPAGRRLDLDDGSGKTRESRRARRLPGERRTGEDPRAGA